MDLKKTVTALRERFPNRPAVIKACLDAETLHEMAPFTGKSAYDLEHWLYNAVYQGLLTSMEVVLYTDILTSEVA